MGKSGKQIFKREEDLFFSKNNGYNIRYLKRKQEEKEAKMLREDAVKEKTKKDE
jgi:hypothetical protein